jgi:hypothetical protein
MSATGWGLLGAAVGIVAGATAVLGSHARRSQTASTAVPSPALTVREALRADGIERFIYTRAAAWSFLVVLATVGVIGGLASTLDWTTVGRWIVGAVWGIGGAAFGLASAIIARRSA